MLNMGWGRQNNINQIYLTNLVAGPWVRPQVFLVKISGKAVDKLKIGNFKSQEEFSTMFKSENILWEKFEFIQYNSLSIRRRSLTLANFALNQI